MTGRPGAGTVRRMETNLRGRVAIVTGGAQRIGRATVDALAAAGCGVIVHYRRSAKEAAEAVLCARAAGVPAHRVRADLSGEAGCRFLIDEAKRLAGRLDVLVNNAAVFDKTPLERISSAALDAEFRANLFAPILLTRFFAAATRRGHVINLLDRRIAGHDTSCPGYLLTKKGLAAFTEVAALALAPRIRVNAVAPGPILPPPGRSMAYLRDHAGRIPLRKGPTPADVASAVLALLQGRGTTGQVIFVDGGQHLLGNGV